MAHTKSAIKRIKTNQRDRLKNRVYLSKMRTVVKNFLNLTSKDEAEKQFDATISIIDKLVSKGIIHKNNGANKKSRIARHLNSLAQ